MNITFPYTGVTLTDLNAISAAIAAATETPPPVADLIILNGGKTFYTGQWNYGELVETDGVTYAGELCSQFLATASGGGGGYLPYFELPGLSIVGYNYRHLRMAYTRAGQIWQAVMPYMAPPAGQSGDFPIPGALNVDIAPPVGAGVWFDVWIPLRAGGYNDVNNTPILKMGIQDQINSSGNNPTLGHDNLWYIAYDALTATKPV